MKMPTLVAIALLPGMAAAQSAIDPNLFGTSPAEIEAKANAVITKAIAADSDARIIRAGNKQLWPRAEACYAAVSTSAADGGCGELKKAISCLKSNIFSNKYNLGTFYALADSIVSAAKPMCDAEGELANLKAQKQAIPTIQMEQPGNPNKVNIIPVGYNMAILDANGRPTSQFVVRDLKPLGLKFYKDGRTSSEPVAFDSLETYGMGLAKVAGGQLMRLSMGGNDYPIQAQVPGSLVGSSRDTENIRMSAIFGVFVMPAMNRVLEMGMELNGQSMNEARFKVMY